MASFLSALLASRRSKRDEKLAIETGYKIAHQYLTCYRTFEHERDFESLSDDQRYVRVVEHIHEAEPRDIKDSVLKIMVEPSRHLPAHILAEHGWRRLVPPRTINRRPLDLRMYLYSLL